MVIKLKRNSCENLYYCKHSWFKEYIYFCHFGGPLMMILAFRSVCSPFYFSIRSLCQVSKNLSIKVCQPQHFPCEEMACPTFIYIMPITIAVVHDSRQSKIDVCLILPNRLLHSCTELSSLTVVAVLSQVVTISLDCRHGHTVHVSSWTLTLNHRRKSLPRLWCFLPLRKHVLHFC